MGDPVPCVYEFFPAHLEVRRDATQARLGPPRGVAPIAVASAPGRDRRLRVPVEGFATCARVRGALIHHGEVAALCVAHGVEALLSRDRDLSLFPELAIQDPLAAP